MSDTNDTPRSTTPQRGRAAANPAVPAELHGTAERAHPLARRDFFTLMDRSEADLRCVAAAVDSRLGNGSTSDKQEQARFTVKCFVEAHGHFPGARELERWRAADPVRKRVFLSDGAIRKAFGGTWAAVEAAWVNGSVALDLTARRLTALGPSFSEDELVAVGHAFLAATRRRQGAMDGFAWAWWLRHSGRSRRRAYDRGGQGAVAPAQRAPVGGSVAWYSRLTGPVVMTPPGYRRRSCTDPTRLPAPAGRAPWRGRGHVGSFAVRTVREARR